MGNHDSSKGRGTPSAKTGGEALPAGDGAGAATPMMALASAEPPASDIAKTGAAPAATAASAAAIEPELPLPMPADLEAPKFDLPESAAIGAVETAADSPSLPDQPDEAPVTASTPYAPAAGSRFPLLAASLALAASLGAMVGGLIATSLVRSAPPPVLTAAKSGIEEIQALKEQVVQVRVDLAALKTSMEAGQRTANTQITKIGERVERIDRTQAEPVAKLTKAIEGFERRSQAETAKLAKASESAERRLETTGTVSPPQPIAGSAKPQAGGIEGWVLRDVTRGTAVIEGRLGMIEVDAGDVVPGLGRIDAIRKQDGRWVVVTSKGLILPPR